MGITQHTTGVDNVLSCANLAMLTGQIGRPSTGVNPCAARTRAGRVRHGRPAQRLPAYQAVTIEAVHVKFEQAWGSTSPMKVGLTVADMVNAAHHGTVKALYIMGENPMVSDPDLHHVQAAWSTANSWWCRTSFRPRR